MRFTVLAAIAASFLATSAMAADPNMPAQSGPGNPAVKTTAGNNASMPVSGANSFTRGEAQSRILAKGYSHVSGLAKDSNGVWRGKAMKDGQPVNVSVDFQGNVNS